MLSYYNLIYSPILVIISFQKSVFVLTVILKNASILYNQRSALIF